MPILKQWFVLGLTVSLMFFTSCKEEEDPTSFIDTINAPGDQEFGFARGEKNGLAWESSAYWTYNPFDSTEVNFFFTTYEVENLYERESLDVGSMALSTGTYEILPFAIGGDNTYSTVFFLTAGGDAIIAGLQLDSTRNNFVNISSYDPVSTSIAGSFTLHYELDGETRLSYENCEFEARLFRE